MIIIVGATGQIGSNIVRELNKSNAEVRAIVHKSKPEFNGAVDVKSADFLNADEAVNAFAGGTTAFLLTPERPDSEDILEETKQIVDNYRIAVEQNGIKRIVGLSCIGAQIEKGTGNILMSRMLELAFDDLDIEKIFVRPSYYYSNWLGYIELMKEAGVLPTFFPDDLKVDMLSPVDVARFASKCLLETKAEYGKKIFELAGPEKYNAKDIAEVFSKKLNKNISTQVISKEDRIPTLRSVGFTENTAQNLSDMTQAVIDHLATPEFTDKVIKMPTKFEDYLDDILHS